MSFFSFIGLTPVGGPTLSTANLEITPDCDDPASAVECLVYASNKFADDYISVGKGYYVMIDDDNPFIHNLFMIRVKGDDTRVAQISVIEELHFIANKTQKHKNKCTYLFHGVHSLDTDKMKYIPEYYFLSKNIY